MYVVQIKSIKMNIFVILSALFFVASFLTPCFIGTFCYVGLLYYTAKRTDITFFEGFVWGCIVFGVQGAGLFYVVFNDGIGVMRLMYPLLFVVYCAFHSALWIKFSQSLTHNYRVVGWIVGAVIYGYYIHWYLLWPLGRVEGYPFVFPLIPLVNVTGIIHPSIWKYPLEMLTALIALQVSFVEGFEKKSYWILTFIAAVPLCAGSFISIKKPIKPEWFKCLCYIKPSYSRTHSLETAQQLCHTMMNAQTSEFQMFITPESVFPFPVQEGLCTQMWCEYALDNKLFLVSGHALKNNKLYNSVFLIDQCRIILNYNKSHLIPTFERTIQEKRFNKRTFFNFFLSKRRNFSRSKNLPPLVSYKSIGPFIPVICSELFWLTRFHSSIIPAVAVINDGCFGQTRFDYSLLQTARFQALCESRWIVYVGWNYAYFISPLGLTEYFR